MQTTRPLHLSPHAKGLLLAVVGILVLSPDSLLIRLIAADAWSLLFWRGLMSGFVLSLYLAVTQGPQAFARILRIGLLGFVTAILFALNTTLFVVSVRHTAVANTLVLLSVSPLFGAVFSSIFLREHAPPRTWIATLICIGSIFYIMSEGMGEATLIGDSAALGVALTMAAILTLLRARRSSDAIVIVALSGLMLALVTLPFAAPFSLSGSSWLYMGTLGLIVIPLSFALTLSAPKYLPAPEVGLIFLLETILGPFLVWWFIGEEPPAATLFGGMVLIATLSIHAAFSLRRPVAPDG
jgi:drug/metabolite transporter (DMT)-like permease